MASWMEWTSGASSTWSGRWERYTDICQYTCCVLEAIPSSRDLSTLFCRKSVLNLPISDISAILSGSLGRSNELIQTWALLLCFQSSHLRHVLYDGASVLVLIWRQWFSFFHHTQSLKSVICYIYPVALSPGVHAPQSENLPILNTHAANASGDEYLNFRSTVWGRQGYKLVCPPGLKHEERLKCAYKKLGVQYQRLTNNPGLAELEVKQAFGHCKCWVDLLEKW